jgi:hypothetical protein
MNLILILNFAFILSLFWRSKKKQKNGENGMSAFELFFPTTIFVKWNVFDCSDADEIIAFGSRRGCRD